MNRREFIKTVGLLLGGLAIIPITVLKKSTDLQMGGILPNFGYGTEAGNAMLKSGCIGHFTGVTIHTHELCADVQLNEKGRELFKKIYLDDDFNFLRLMNEELKERY